ncbi:MAG TPA: hypothetical protein VK994_08030, partial [Bacteroidales bacterium]|nr:hypothetical protein [Bacteroidales bacterium]
KRKFNKKEIKERPPALRKFWTQQMLEHILGIVKVVVDDDSIAQEEKVKIWNMLSIGTDFDGMINPEDGFITAEEFADFREMALELLPQQNDVDRLLLGLSAEEAIDKFTFDNAVSFARMYYFQS